MKNLNQLFEKNKINGIETGFDELANYLMNECILAINGNEYRIAEIEFYYCKKNEDDKNNHQDIFTHCNEKQKETNKFYFHGSGIDITFGNENYYGGILLRSLIKNLEDENRQEIIFGPLKILDEILDNGYNKENNFELKISLREKNLNKKYILKSCRVGLKINDTDNCNSCGNLDKEEIIRLKETFIFKPYRYILNDEYLLLKLLNQSNNEPAFLAWFITNEKINPKNINIKNTKLEKLKYRINNLLKNFDDNNKENFKNKKFERKKFIEKCIQKICEEIISPS